MAPPTFNPDTNIPDLSGKVILITGGTAGLGAASVIELAKHKPAHIYFTGRNTTAADSVIKQIRGTTSSGGSGSETQVTFLECDLASLASVKSTAELFLEHESRIDVLMCNAGVMAAATGLTRNGYEVQFGINHLGHALLIKKLLPALLATAAGKHGESDARIIILTSLGFGAHPRPEGIIFKHLKTTQDFLVAGPWRRYGQSKLANMLYAQELARRHPSITSLSVHPGVVSTGLVENLSFANRAIIYLTNIGKVVTTEEGALNQLWAISTEKSKIKNGQLYEPVGQLSSRSTAQSRDEKLAAKLWDWTEEELKAY